MVNIKGYALSDKPIFFTLSRIMDSDFWSSYLVVPGLEVSRLGTGCKNDEPDDGVIILIPMAGLQGHGIKHKFGECI